ncbi:hypothetical protein L3Q72_20115 [Vibrio sp. JC009]|uniref:hypothetical protein n=1 Tax=Vibrio sp. JC009 TaxID=2912314 RepID=UPI0023B05B3F|nr:hypothetical protein [Vibrio sp. JC009]WED23547.1 hypothetical protein L3Q72_20115 [Vibrio sp. JC009]
MPDLYCQSCKQITPHKSVMRRNVDESAPFTRKFAQLLGQIASGKHYYNMELQQYCRVCNCQHIETGHTGTHGVQHVDETTQVSFH